MKNFAILLQTLILTPSRKRKLNALADYLANTPDPDRGYALAAITGDLSSKNLKSSTLKEITKQHVDPVLYDLSYDYVGDTAETIALIWPTRATGELPSVSDFIQAIETGNKQNIAKVIAGLLAIADPNERWAMIKLVTGGLRIGVSARLAKTALAQYSGQELAEIEKIWHGLQIPYTELFAWLDGKAAKPIISHAQIFHPMMLAHPINAQKDFAKMRPADYQVEWKWDGIRVQLVIAQDTKRLFSRTGDDISAAFPEIIQARHAPCVLDGELLVGHNFAPMPFNCLQQRLNRKQARKKHLTEYPAFIRVYDILFDGDVDIRSLPLSERRQRLESWYQQSKPALIDLSKILTFADWQALGEIRATGAQQQGYEGVMIKHQNSHYIAGRPRGAWFKWKRDPKLVDAILMYAQRGHGKRSSYYSDYTFGVWQNGGIVPIGKAYSGFSDEELQALDKFVRANTVARFGPVRELKKALVVEVAFDSAHTSTRHKSGIALRFPRIHRIRWDKPVAEVLTLDLLREELLID